MSYEINSFNEYSSKKKKKKVLMSKLFIIFIAKLRVYTLYI